MAVYSRDCAPTPTWKTKTGSLMALEERIVTTALSPDLRTAARKLPFEIVALPPLSRA